MFKNKKVLVLGLGRSGKAAIRLLDYFHADITINDKTPAYNVKEYQEYIDKGYRVILGEQPESLFEEDFDFVVKVPGINYHADFVLRLKERHIPVYTEIELGYMVSQKQNYIAITGTNGKTTTVSLIYKMLQDAGRETYICGNYGIPFCDVVMDHELYKYSGADIVVEMSNFQLIDINRFHPHISCILNLTPDHLDYMDSLDEYYASKTRIYMNCTSQDIYIQNNDDQTLLSYLKQYPPYNTIETFSTVGGGDCYLKDNSIYYKDTKIIDRKDIKVVGLHNISNMMCAIIACIHSGLSVKDIHGSLSSFTGVEHRIEYVRTLNGVKYYNDSKGTNTDAAIIALKAFDQPVILLMGGKEKGLDLTEMSTYNDHIKTLITYGAARERFAKDMHHDNTYIEEYLKDAIEKAYELATEGDVVLLSPSTSSFDEFNNYEERGRYFKKIVNEL